MSKLYPHITKIYEKMQSVKKRTKGNNSKPLHTPVNTSQYSEARQAQFSWHLNLEVLYSFCKEVNGSGEPDPIGELDIFINILQMHIEINVN